MTNWRRFSFWIGFLILGGSLGLMAAEGDGDLILLARNTFCLTLGACAISLPIGTVLALLLTRTDLPWRRAVWGVWMSVLFVPLYLQAAAWKAGFYRWGWCSLASEPVGPMWVRNWSGAVWVHGLAALPWVLLIVGLAAQLTEPELEEVALLDASPWRVFWRVTVRRALPGVGIAALWVMIMVAGEIVVTDQYQIRTLAEQLYTGWAIGSGESGVPGLRLAWLSAGLLTGMIMMILPRFFAAPAHVSYGQRPVFHLNRWRWPLVALVGMLFAVAVLVPIGSLVYKAGIDVRLVDGLPVRGWSGAKLLRLLVPLPGTYRLSAIWRFKSELQWTWLLGCSAASLALAVAVPISWAACRSASRAIGAMTIVAVGLATSGPLVGVTVIWLMTRCSQPWCVWIYDQSLFAPVLAVGWRCLPLVLLICWAGFGSLNRSVFDAAALDGAGSGTQLFRIAIPQRKLVLAVAWLAAIAIAFGELSASKLVVPPGITTVPIRVFSLLHYGIDDQAAAICLTGMIGMLLTGTTVVAAASLAVRSICAIMEEPRL